MSSKRVSQMTGDEIRAIAGAARTVKLRISGAPADLAAVAAVLAREFTVVDKSRPQTNRYDPGERIYVIVQIGGQR